MIYLDLDGVFADHDGQYHKLTGGNAKSDKEKLRHERLKPFPHFYLDLPLLPGAMELWHFVKSHNPTFLSAASNFVPHSREDKRAWVLHHFGVNGDRVIITDYPQDKKNYAQKGDILIDDRPDNCEEWERQGGIAIHHKNAADTIAKLKTILTQEEQALATFREFIRMA